MRKNICYILLGFAALASCESSDMPLSLPEEATIITFNASKGAVLTRADADHGHRDWDVDKDPSTMTVAAWADNEAVFTNQAVTYVPADGQTPAKWTYTPPKYWANLQTSNKECTFVACMPQNDDATTTKNPSTITIAAQYSLTKEDGTTQKPIFFDEDSKRMPLVTHDVTTIESFKPEAVEFVMDQTLAGYKLKFALGEDMGNLRFFRIKEVKVYGLLPYRGTMTCTYTKDADKWTKNIEWSSLSNYNIEKANAVDIPNTGEGGKHVDLDVKKGSEYPWSGVFYGIPSTSFNPTIKVKYDVIEVYDGHDTHITRQDVESEIVFSSTNFSAYTTPAAVGKISTILIKIVPSYLYVLSDCDQKSGFIVAE